MNNWKFRTGTVVFCVLVWSGCVGNTGTTTSNESFLKSASLELTLIYPDTTLVEDQNVHMQIDNGDTVLTRAGIFRTTLQTGKHLFTLWDEDNQLYRVTLLVPAGESSPKLRLNYRLRTPPPSIVPRKKIEIPKSVNIIFSVPT